MHIEINKTGKDYTVSLFHDLSKLEQAFLLVGKLNSPFGKDDIKFALNSKNYTDEQVNAVTDLLAIAEDTDEAFARKAFAVLYHKKGFKHGVNYSSITKAVYNIIRVKPYPFTKTA